MNLNLKISWSIQTSLFLVILFLQPACSDSDDPATEETAMDQEGRIFKTVKIGNQIWSAENLDVGTFRDGGEPFEINSEEEWDLAFQHQFPAYCYYNYDATNGPKYGRLYNWYAVNHANGLAPEGWHVPSDAEWTTLVNALGGDATAGFKMKSVEWTGDNSSGFNAIPAGHGTAGAFTSIDEDATWWSATPHQNNAWLRSLGPGHDVVRSNYPQVGFFSIRLVKD